MNDHAYYVLFEIQNRNMVYRQIGKQYIMHLLICMRCICIYIRRDATRCLFTYYIFLFSFHAFCLPLNQEDRKTAATVRACVEIALQLCGYEEEIF